MESTASMTSAATTRPQNAVCAFGSRDIIEGSGIDFDVVDLLNE